MSATGSGPDGGRPDGTDDHGYFQAIEERFLELRGAPLLLAPADWRVAQEWHRRGVPLALVLGTIEELFAKRQERGASARRISGLRYFRRAVDAAFEEARALQAPAVTAGTAPALDVPARLAALAAALPEDCAGRSGLVREIRAAGEGAEAGGIERVEERLGEIERRAEDRLLEGLPDEERELLEAAVEATVGRLARSLPAEELARSRERLLRQKVRKRAGLPSLSLFAPEAEPAAG